MILNNINNLIQITESAHFGDALRLGTHFAKGVADSFRPMDLLDRSNRRLLAKAYKLYKRNKLDVDDPVTYKFNRKVALAVKARMPTDDLKHGSSHSGETLARNIGRATLPTSTAAYLLSPNDKEKSK